ncbi:putative chaperonin Cpn60/TCP-1 family, groEL-like apical domain superfamily [Helianthus annuus]|nr:putative chaperonin Cpn60/TCP-1 family, groEL-like apical domain superfamily [Helianthus annuus]
MLIINKHQAGLKVCAIKAPGFGDNRRANLEDLAVLTGGEVISEERGLSLNDVQLDKLGTAKKVTVSLDDTIILHGGGDKKQIEERCEELRATVESSTAMFDKEKAQERLSKLSGGVAVFKVGGASEAEVGERKDRATDALNATRAAVEEGIVPGGGVALLYATRVLKSLKTANEDQKRGVEIVENALKVFFLHFVLLFIFIYGDHSNIRLLFIKTTNVLELFYRSPKYDAVSFCTTFSKNNA